MLDYYSKLEKQGIWVLKLRQNLGHTALWRSGILEKLDIRTPDIVIKVNPERADLIETRLIDGRECLVITVNDRVEINGLEVHTIRPQRRS